MTTIGTSVAGFNLAGSIVGAARAESAGDRTKAAAADQKAVVDRAEILSRTLEDISDADSGTERDADGRQAYRRAAPHETALTEAEALGDFDSRRVSEKSQHAIDPAGELGNSLDIDA